MPIRCILPLFINPLWGMNGCILKFRTDSVWWKRNIELAILNTIFSCTVSAEIDFLHQCVLFWKAHALALNVMVNIISSIQSLVKAKCGDMAWVGSVWAAHSFPGLMGVNLIFHSVERTHILWRDQGRDTNVRHFVLMSVLTPDVWGWVSGGVRQLKSLAKTGPSYLHKRLPPSATLFTPTQGISTPTDNTKICAHKRLGLLRRISTCARLWGAARAKVLSSLLLSRDCLSQSLSGSGRQKLSSYLYRNSTAQLTAKGVLSGATTESPLAGKLSTRNYVVIRLLPHLQKQNKKEVKVPSGFLCLSQWYWNRCLRGEIWCIWSLSWILLMVLKSHLLLETVFLSVSLKVCKGSSKIKMLSWSCVKRKRLASTQQFRRSWQEFLMWLKVSEWQISNKNVTN